MLTEFFEEVMLAEDGQDILRYDPSLDVEVSNRYHGDNLNEIYQKQRFAPLLECIPSKFNRNEKDKLESILKSSELPSKKWVEIKRLFDV